MDILNYVGDFANIAGSVAAAGAVFTFLQARAARPVTVQLVAPNDTIVVSFEIPRAAFSRAEVLGRTGLFARPGIRFSVAFFSDRRFLCAVDAARPGAALVIPLAQNEVDQFT